MADNGTPQLRQVYAVNEEGIRRDEPGSANVPLLYRPDQSIVTAVKAIPADVQAGYFGGWENVKAQFDYSTDRALKRLQRSDMEQFGHDIVDLIEDTDSGLVVPRLLRIGINWSSSKRTTGVNTYDFLVRLEPERPSYMHINKATKQEHIMPFTDLRLEDLKKFLR